MAKHPLEAQLTALTQEFVGKLVDVIRNASFADVAALPGASSSSAPRASRPNATGGPTPTARRSRQTTAKRDELGDRLLEVLRANRQPMGVRALASELGVDAGALAVPLRYLRAGNRVHKHGEKRATTYSAT